MKEARLKYTEFLIDKQYGNGIIVKKVQEVYNVHRATVYRDIKKLSHFCNDPSK